MSWLPIGPDFVFSPKNVDYKRVSRRNSWGKGCMVSEIALDPTDNRTIYVVDRPDNGGATAFRTRNDGARWTPISDDLQQERNPLIDPHSIAVNPSHPERIYMGTCVDLGVYISDSRGERGSWSVRHPINGQVRKLIVDPRTSADLNHTVIYAATDTGVYVSTDGGVTWPTSPTLSGNVWTLTAYIPVTGTPHFYAGVKDVGVYHSTLMASDAGWELLSTGASGMLPRHDTTTPDGNFEVALVDYSVRNPDRVYVWLIRSGVSVGLYTTASATNNWQPVPMASPPGPLYLYAYAFAVAPNSPGDGDGSRDVLFIGSETLWRSIDGGRNWQDDRGFMSDFHDIKFGPYSAGSIPYTYIGCDGGIARSNLAASPDYPLTPHGEHPPGDYNEVAQLRDLGVWQNLNYGRHASAPFFYASDPKISALSYLCFQDTSFAAGNAALGWWDVGGGGDGFQIAAKQADDGVKLWIHSNTFFGRITDTGQPQQSYYANTLGVGGPGLLSTSRNLVVDASGNCVAGVQYDDAGTVRRFVTRVDVNGIATRISADFPGTDQVSWVAVHPTNTDVVCCALGWERMAMRTSAGPPDIAWTQFALPDGITPGPRIIAIAIDTAGRVLIMLDRKVRTAASSFMSPILEVSPTQLISRECTFPTSFDDDPRLNFGPIVAHPLNADVFYAAHGARVYKLVWAQMRWNWEDISDGLPGQWVYDLWIGNIAPPSAPPRILLRAAVVTRSAWEREVTDGASVPTTALYLRDNFLDQWWQNRSPSDVPNPYAPSDPGRRLYHYQCEDIKIDAQQPGREDVGDFFQTDPEVNPLTNTVDPNRPMTHTIFDLLKDNSQHLPSLNQAWVHVQVHNHSTIPANDVSVWVLFCRAASGVANLNSRRNMDRPYDFWSQFRTDGTIVPNLPAGSPWVAIGPPVVLQNITAATPQVASWLWTVPPLLPGDLGHHCVVAFIHSSAGPLRETSTEVDIITPGNKQIGQKNLHIGPPLPLMPGSGMAMDGDTGITGSGQMDEYIEFHNSSSYQRVASLVFDLRSLPPELRVKIRFSRLDTLRPLPGSITGAHPIGLLPASTEPGNVTTTTGGKVGGVTDHQGGRVARLFQQLLRWVMDILRLILGLDRGSGVPRIRSYEPITEFGPTVYEAEPSALVTVSDVQIPEFGFVGARFSVENTGKLAPGSEYRFQIQQVVKDQLVGGTVYVVRIAGEQAIPVWDGKLEEVQIEDKLEHLPNWIQEVIKARMDET